MTWRWGLSGFRKIGSPYTWTHRRVSRLIQTMDDEKYPQHGQQWRSTTSCGRIFLTHKWTFLILPSTKSKFLSIIFNQFNQLSIIISIQVWLRGVWGHQGIPGIDEKDLIEIIIFIIADSDRSHWLAAEALIADVMIFATAETIYF